MQATTPTTTARRTVFERRSDELPEAFSEPERVGLLAFAAVEVGFDRFCIALRFDNDGESV
jgi:hypothetical protein